MGVNGGLAVGIRSGVAAASRKIHTRRWKGGQSVTESEAVVIVLMVIQIAVAVWAALRR
mgnify:CR=1 FL=1